MTALVVLMYYRLTTNIYLCFRKCLLISLLPTKRLVFNTPMNKPVDFSKPIDNSHLALRKTLDIICGKWRLYIIYQLGTEARRYGELRRMIPEVSEKVLIQELKALTNLGVIEKKAYSDVPPRVEYSLTAKGKHVLPTLIDLTSIGETFLEP